LAALRVDVLLWQCPTAEAGLSVAAGERAVGLAAGAYPAMAWQMHAHLALGEALLHAGQPGHAGQVLLAAGGGPLLPNVSALRRVRWWEALAAAAVGESDLARADEYAALAVKAVGEAPTDIRRGFAFRSRAYVDSARGATGAALAAGEEAVASFAAAGALLELGRVHVLIASACVDAGRIEDVAQRLAMAGALARRCQSARLLEMVEAQLGRLPADAARRDWQSMLTPRERDIAVLAGQAMASTEIAAKLHLSVRTVDSHLGRIYRKLGVANRVALANLLNAGAGRSGAEV
jgi:DNA-binding CsgD family transcriptional regulator